MNMVMQKQLKIEKAHCTKTSIAIFDNDAKACYDQMIVPLTSTFSQNAGISKETVGTLINTLDKAHYHVRTNAGTSDDLYCSTIAQKIQGSCTGQGNTRSGPLWELFFTVINISHILYTRGIQYDTTRPHQINYINHRIHRRIY